MAEVVQILRGMHAEGDVGAGALNLLAQRSMRSESRTVLKWLCVSKTNASFAAKDSRSMSMISSANS